ncbi:Uma2 family endonuclease [Pseudaminobacter sp. 19-2017]|uniref:Uma2 family endonuclease n=1 Tax=Pseudaminobacter soli (ex Zhang et al. 2022) TaxID=2831468 RepID=A0A942IAG7_9HYPH|nr:Uma2 family endonuclease [Pseudaminobacter soli]MBS3651320.1 Uma2 family endonuclease [Pseudaminobacter soli]
MAEQGKKTATYADLEAVPPHLVAEIIDGELMTHPRPSFRHGGTASALNIRLGNAFQFGGAGGPGGWIFVAEPELKLGSQILVPDIAAWRRDRLTTYPKTNYVETVPDWVCEVLSASTERRDRTVKMRIYAEAGVPYLWIIDPRQQILETFELLEGRWTKFGAWNSDDQVRAPPFDAISFSLADLWPLDRPLGFNEDPQALYAGDR